MYAPATQSTQFLSSSKQTTMKRWMNKKNWENKHTREISSVSTNRRDAKFIYIKITSDEKSTMI